jgi:hypothetical protein
MLWGAHAPRVQISAPSPKCFACNQREDVGLYNKVRDREDALASTRQADRALPGIRLRCC